MATALFLDAAAAAMPFFYNYCTFKLFFKISRLGSAANLSVVNFRPYVQKRGKGRGKKKTRHLHAYGKEYGRERQNMRSNNKKEAYGVGLLASFLCPFFTHFPRLFTCASTNHHFESHRGLFMEFAISASMRYLNFTLCGYHGRKVAGSKRRGYYN
ncbi:hypothetical protein Tb11.01.2450 [Trypanosoma brucei brucei TREU927]|uniref:Uncharacterized protein n=1 Tax=Trypanosoma brucei brucei (strain 927/4 GUTat10.1) TaxID=185431 RepID=Q383L1_TRYB2|nr:hypothetical protein Tb11.01.2450 [Trypanosoma brucei brucei TREU927]EAN80020.1 hypothetical protein Tb11.01.2450 [Trypanosoma brucei brucei TREU927]